MNPYEIDVVDSLSLLALKCAPNVFDLSSTLQHISIRDQIVRAQLVVRDLHKGDPDFDNLLVVGAGVAGMAAALAAAALGKRVVVLDAKDAPFSLFRNIHGRYVGPFMYEWPSAIHGTQSYPPRSTGMWGPWLKTSPKWRAADPVPAHQLFEALTRWGKRALRGTNVSVFLNTDRQATLKFVREFAHNEGVRGRKRMQRQAPGPRSRLAISETWTAWTKNCAAKAGARFAPAYVLLAGGMGSEDTNLCRYEHPKIKPAKPIKGCDFWGEDKLRNRGVADMRVGIFGGGDGAMQDAMRALTYFEHPLKMLTELERDKRVKRLIGLHKGDLNAIEQQSRLLVNWTAGPSAYEQVDASCRAIAMQLAKYKVVVKRVGESVRKGDGLVIHCVREKHFSKSYLLNRFLVHLIDACQPPGGWPQKMRYDLRFEHVADDGNQNPGNPLKYRIYIKENRSGAPVVPENFDEVAVRYGIERGSIPGFQLIQMSKNPSRQRTTLAHIGLPFMLNEPPR
jgi:hypothetical protein